MRISRGEVGGGISTIVIVLIALYFGVEPSVFLNLSADFELLVSCTEPRLDLSQKAGWRNLILVSCRIRKTMACSTRKEGQTGG